MARTKKSVKKKLSRLIGFYQLGIERVELRIDPTSGSGWFTRRHVGKRGVVVMTIGTKDTWRDAVGVLVHEATELAFDQVRACFRPGVDFSDGTDVWVFHLDHNQFSEATARVGHFIAQCLRPMHDSAKAYQRSKK